MAKKFEELAWAGTPMGEISLRRRLDPTVGHDVYEVKLGDEFLMSSLFTVAEEELARLGLALLSEADAGPGAPPLSEDDGPGAAPLSEDGGSGAALLSEDGGGPGASDGNLDVVVGGLGLGFTAGTVLEDPRVRSLLVVDALEEIISWHRAGLLPFSTPVTTDKRSRLVHGDFFALTADPAGYDPDNPGRRFHAVLVDIDHSPRHLLNPGHSPFYSAAGLRALAQHLHPGGVFGLWSDDPPDEEFTALLAEVFPTVRAETVAFPNPLVGGTSANTVYLARTA